MQSLVASCNAETGKKAVRSHLSKRIIWLLLCVVALGAAVRFWGINWDDTSGQHPDERHVLMCTWRLSWPQSIKEYFDEAHSPLNPRNREAHFYAYGSLPSTILRGVVELGGIKSPQQMAIAGRALSALFDTGSIVLVFALAWNLYRSRNVAILSALLYSLSVLPIQHAHFFVVDPFASFFALLTLLFLAIARVKDGFLNYILIGFSFGLGVSCKISVGTLSVLVGFVVLLEMRRSEAGTVRMILYALVRILIFGLSALICIRLAMPDAFYGFWPWQLAPRWLANMSEVVAISTGVTDIPFTRQFYGRTPLLWPWWNMVMWGMGLILGVTASLGWGVAFARMVHRRDWRHLIPVVWVALVFFHLGFTYQSTLRYFLPIYGCLCVLAAWILAHADGRTSFSNIHAWLKWLMSGGVVILTAGWAFAFLSIYSKPHTRLEASEWLYKNATAGSSLACEHWDDFLPLPLRDGRNPSLYNFVELPHYVADNMEKRGELLAKLNQADFIILASQKLRDSIPRMPHRYPFTIRYYEWLEDGSLGFDRVAEFTRELNFFGIHIPTRSAEEAFSVYDHPPVVIYRKSKRYDPEILVKKFNAIPIDEVTDTREPSRAFVLRQKDSAGKVERLKREESAILFSKERWAQVQLSGTWTAIFSRESFAAQYPIIAWSLLLLCFQAIGCALLGPWLRSIPDRGAALARPLVLLVVSWVFWLTASLGIAKFDRANLWILMGGATLAAIFAFWRSRKDWIEWWSQGFGPFWRGEVVFWAGFSLFLIIRMANPDLWHPAWGGEKPMEMTFLYGVLKSDTFPSMNPWYGGGFINYYYFGFVHCATLIKALGVVPEVGFNLCLATFFGMACSATFIAARMLRPIGGWTASWLATLFVMVCGNLFEIRFIWRCLVRLGQSSHSLSFPVVSDCIRAAYGLIDVMYGVRLAPYDADLYWVSARAIEGDEIAPVTEFPFWSFLYGDLHPHLISLTFTLCAITLIIAWARGRGWRQQIMPLALLSLVIGSFWPTNTWDWPTYSGLAGLVFFFVYWSWEADDRRGFVVALIKAVFVFSVIIILGRLAFWPYIVHYVPGYGSFELWRGNKTSLIDYLFIYGLPVFVILTSKFQYWYPILKSKPPWLWLLFLAALIAVVGYKFNLLSAFLVLGIVASVCTVWSKRRLPLDAMPALLCLIAFFLSLFVEHVVLVGDVGRMNTVFKFYYQVWVCFGLAAALELPALWASTKWIAGKCWWRISLTSLVLLSFAFPIFGTYAKSIDRFGKTPWTLDGLLFAETARYSMEGREFELKGDLHAIRWLQDNVMGSPVILEMNTANRLYTWGARYSIHTGLPSIVGWSWHQRQQQAGLAHDKVDERIADVREIYRTDDPIVARKLLAKYGVRLIIVGELERIYGTKSGLEKFKYMGFPLIYDSDGVQIYQVGAPVTSRRD